MATLRHTKSNGADRRSQTPGRRNVVCQTLEVFLPSDSPAQTRSQAVLPQSSQIRIASDLADLVRESGNPRQFVHFSRQVVPGEALFEVIPALVKMQETRRKVPDIADSSPLASSKCQENANYDRARSQGGTMGKCLGLRGLDEKPYPTPYGPTHYG